MKKIVFTIIILLLVGCTNNVDTNQDNSICDQEYKPVCGKINIQCITTPCNQVEETFANECIANQRKAFDIKESDCLSDFEKCVDLGNPIMESYPRKCRNGDITYTEEIGPIQ
ncbi:MAG: hypothetical protein O2779_05525 [Nanoarchaeota archaeon]|nr:hypothetical protein [Nanoarchaeota archaeon]